MVLFAGVLDRSRRDESFGAALAGLEDSGEELERSRRWEALAFSCVLEAGLSRSGEEEEESSSLSEPERDSREGRAFRVVPGTKGAATKDGLLGRSAAVFLGGGEEEGGDLVSLEGGRLWPDKALSRAGSGDGEQRCVRGSRSEGGAGVDLCSGCRGRSLSFSFPSETGDGEEERWRGERRDVSFSRFSRLSRGLPLGARRLGSGEAERSLLGASFAVSSGSALLRGGAGGVTLCREARFWGATLRDLLRELSEEEEESGEVERPLRPF